MGRGPPRAATNDDDEQNLGHARSPRSFAWSGQGGRFPCLALPCFALFWPLVRPSFVVVCVCVCACVCPTPTPTSPSPPLRARLRWLLFLSSLSLRRRRSSPILLLSVPLPAAHHTTPTPTTRAVVGAQDTTTPRREDERTTTATATARLCPEVERRPFAHPARRGGGAGVTTAPTGRWFASGGRGLLPPRCSTDPGAARRGGRALQRCSHACVAVVVLLLAFFPSFLPRGGGEPAADDGRVRWGDDRAAEEGLAHTTTEAEPAAVVTGSQERRAEGGDDGACGENDRHHTTRAPSPFSGRRPSGDATGRRGHTLSSRREETKRGHARTPGRGFRLRCVQSVSVTG